MDYLKVKGHSNLYRDPETNSIVNKNSMQYQEYISRRDSRSEENQKINDLESDFARMKEDINEIKNLLRSLANEPR
tara:strand:- start:1175 stop:1402 length:228 start_codon:yes stop_codon:yes gene_type:complete